MNEKRVIIVSDSERFIVKSIIKKLEESGISSTFSTIDIKRLSSLRCEPGSLIYLYIDDNTDLNLEGLTYLRDMCWDNDYEFFIIGYTDIIAELKKTIFVGCVTGEYVRPVNVGQLVEEIKCEIDKEDTMGHKKHILVVDDSGIMLSTIKGWLDEKYRVTPVNSALNAISFLSKERPDLILLDYEMPACSGPQFLEMLRNDPNCSNIPVIFLTGRDDAASVRSVLSLKPAGYLLKSLPKEKIVGEIDKFFIMQKG
ncbi:MAG: response regulator [Lachnospiraceae bacterium]|nr:response regulator [Lachnospiraceae bacterium]